MEEDQSDPVAVLGVSEESDGSIRTEKRYIAKDASSWCMPPTEHRIPITGYAMNGSTTDTVWNKKAIEHLKDNFVSVFLTFSVSIIFGSFLFCLISLEHYKIQNKWQ